MSKYTKITSAITQIFLAICFIFQFTLPSEADEFNQDIGEIASFPADKYWNDLFETAISDLNIEKKFNIERGYNHPVEDDIISLIIFDSINIDELNNNPLRKSCKYISVDKSITCDAEMFRYYASIFGVDRNVSVEFGPNAIVKAQSHTFYEENSEAMKSHYLAMVRWVVAHEFGHAHHNHQGEFSMGPSFELSDSTKEDVEAKINICHRYEKEADLYAQSLIRGTEFGMHLYGEMVHLINLMKLKANCPTYEVGYTCDAMRGMDGTGVTLGGGKISSEITATHPSFVLRVLDILDATWDDDMGGFHSQFDNYRDFSVSLVDVAYRGDACFVSLEEQ